MPEHCMCVCCLQVFVFLCMCLIQFLVREPEVGEFFNSIEEMVRGGEGEGEGWAKRCATKKFHFCPWSSSEDV